MNTEQSRELTWLISSLDPIWPAKRYLKACDMRRHGRDTGLGTCAVLLRRRVFGTPGAAAAAGTLHLLVRS
jgi:hypothetical protein